MRPVGEVDRLIEMDPRPDHGPELPSPGADEAQLGDPTTLAELREWAWARGRTDVVGRLDTHAAALRYVAAPSALNLLRLKELMPVRPRAAWVESAVEQLATADTEPAALRAFGRNLAPWLAVMRWQLVADLDEMRGSP